MFCSVERMNYWLMAVDGWVLVVTGNEMRCISCKIRMQMTNAHNRSKIDTHRIMSLNCAGGHDYMHNLGQNDINADPFAWRQRHSNPAPSTLPPPSSCWHVKSIGNLISIMHHWIVGVRGGIYLHAYQCGVLISTSSRPASSANGSIIVVREKLLHPNVFSEMSFPGRDSITEYFPVILAWQSYFRYLVWK